VEPATAYSPDDYHRATLAYLGKLRAAIESLDPSAVERLARLFLEAYQQQRTIFVMGNGGSASTASHWACDLNKGACFHLKRKFRVTALTDNLPTILALANDVDYQCVFVEQLRNFCRPGDLVVGLSASGNSANVVRAIEFANQHDCTTAGLCGFDGGKLKGLVHCCVHVPVHDMQIVEDVHLVVGHLLMRLLGAALGEPDCQGPGDERG